MTDLDLAEAEAARAFAEHLGELSRRYRQPLPGAAERLAQILDDHEAECVRRDREQATLERRARTA